MAKPKVQKGSLKQVKNLPSKKPAVRVIFSSRNRILLAIGIFTLVLGYIALAMGSITLAPILLVAAYCVIIPIAIVAKGKKKPKSSEAQGRN